MTHRKPLFKRFFLLAFVGIYAVLSVETALAQQGPPPKIIRDNEIEATLKEWLSPLLQAAGMGENSVHLVIVDSPQINAFVAGGANIFIYTGLIDRSESPGEIIGVLAHELGHVAGGHLISTRNAMERASYESILGAVLGVGAAILSGDGGAAAAVMSGSASMAERRFLAHTRINESSADQAAMRFLEIAAINPSGLLSFFDKLESEELLPAHQQSEYMRTHPITRNRISALQTGLAQSKYTSQAVPEAWDEQHARMKAKLTGFLNPGRVLWTYDDRDQSVTARYARAIAAYRNNETDDALRGIDALIAEEPENPYFVELKGQMLVDFGRVQEALPHYRRAVEMAPEAGLIRIALGHALIESAQQDQAPLREAIEHLERALRDEPRASRARRLLATAYGRLGEESKAKLNLAEEAVLQSRFDYAKTQAQGVLQTAPPGSREHLQAQDLMAYIETVEPLEKKE
jgi:predicted Zn-dependent protease